MTGKRMGPAELIESTGAYVCKCSELLIKSAFHALKASGKYLKRSFAPVRRESFVFLADIIGRPVIFVKKLKGSISEISVRFKRRAKVLGLSKAVSMQWRESMLALKRKGSLVSTAFNILFPAASVAALIFVINSAAATDYGVAVEYDGAEIGVVTGEDVLGQAQCVVADRVKYYDTDGDYYVTATLAIKPLSSSEDVIDEVVLAEKMENRISMQYDEKPEPEPVQPLPLNTVPEYEEGKVKAYGVRVDGELIGAVNSYESIERALENIKKPYDTGEYVEIDFDKEIEYDLEEFFSPEEIVSDQLIIRKLTGYESAPEYYEVQNGDNLWNIAEDKGMTLGELSSCYATYQGNVIEDLEHSILRVGTLIKIDSEVPYLQVECKKEVTLKSQIQFETIEVEDSSIPEGQVVVDTEGKNGEKRSRALVTYRDGTAVRKKTLDSVIVAEPVSKIVRIGTGVPDEINHNVPEFITEGGGGEYIWPVDGGYISSHQGDGRGHKGIDIAAPYGTPIYAAASGTVIDAGSGWNGGYGNCIIIQNDDGNVTVYGHQSELSAQYGDYVEAGQLIGYVGSTGDSTGNHLHFEVRKDGKYYDPELYVEEN